MSPEQNQTDGPNYPVYPTPSPAVPQPKKRLNLKVLIIAALLLFFVLAVALVAASRYTAKSEEKCTGYSCLNQRFAQCLPSQYLDNSPGGSVRYNINQANGTGCNTTVTYIKAKYAPEVTGKSMTCDMDNREDFRIAAQNVFRFPDDYGCIGELSDFFKEVNAIPNQP